MVEIKLKRKYSERKASKHGRRSNYNGKSNYKYNGGRISASRMSGQRS